MSEERTPYLTPGQDCGLVPGMDNRSDMRNEVERITSRHIAKLLTRLGSTIPPVVEQEIKRQFRFFSNDIISVIGENNDDRQEFNR